MSVASASSQKASPSSGVRTSLGLLQRLRCGCPGARACPRSVPFCRSSSAIRGSRSSGDSSADSASPGAPSCGSCSASHPAFRPGPAKPFSRPSRAGGDHSLCHSVGGSRSLTFIRRDPYPRAILVPFRSDQINERGVAATALQDPAATIEWARSRAAAAAAAIGVRSDVTCQLAGRSDQS